jgi:hypothetical protein
VDVRKFKVGDLVRHRASGEKGVVVKLATDGRCVLSVGIGQDGSASTECVGEVVVQEIALELYDAVRHFEGIAPVDPRSRVKPHRRKRMAELRSAITDAVAVCIDRCPDATTMEIAAVLIECAQRWIQYELRDE